MHALKARVRNGRLVVDEPTELPEGTELNLVVDEESEEMDDAERAELDAVLAEAVRNAKAGHSVDADVVLKELGIRT